jgi:hypothetical protein
MHDIPETQPATQRAAQSAVTRVPVLACPKFLDLLAEFYGEMAAPPAIDAVMVAPEAIPQPQRSLLVHDRDMTSTLACFHGEPIELQVLDCKLTGDHYRRHIVLQTARSRRPAEYGAIRVNLPRLAAPVQAEVLRARGPLGGILTAHGITFRCCPGAYFKILSNELIGESLRLDGPKWLYGRCNCLSDGAGQAIAEVIEILPPLSPLPPGEGRGEGTPLQTRNLRGGTQR